MDGSMQWIVLRGTPHTSAGSTHVFEKRGLIGDVAQISKMHVHSHAGEAILK